MTISTDSGDSEFTKAAGPGPAAGEGKTDTGEHGAQAKPGAKLDISTLGNAVNDASSRAAALWLSFLTFMAYLTMAVGSVTHLMLFRESPIRLPVLNVDLPLVAFFWIAPIFFVLFHFYLFLQIVILVRKAAAYDRLLRTKSQAEQDEHRNQLDTFVILQLLFGTENERVGVTAVMLRGVAIISLVIAPILLLMQFQLIFLPYHLAGVTWLHRVAILADLALIWTFWFAILRRNGHLQLPRIVRRRGAKSSAPSPQRDAPTHFARLARAGRAVVYEYPLALFGSAAVLVFSWCLFTYPGDWIDPMTRFLGGRVNMVQGKPDRWFSNVLVLTYKNVVEEDKPDKPAVVLSLRGRNLRGAVLIGSDLHGVDFLGADLNDARLDYAKLTGANFRCAFPPGENASPGQASNSDSLIKWGDDECTWLRGTSFFSAKLENANFEKAHMQGAMLAQATLQGASLNQAHLQAAVLLDAQLQGANLDGALLHDAILNGANFTGATMKKAELQGALINRAVFSFASLDGASVQNTKGKPAKMLFAEFPPMISPCAPPKNVTEFVEIRTATIKSMLAQYKALQNIDAQIAKLTTTNWAQVKTQEKTDQAKWIQDTVKRYGAHEEDVNRDPLGTFLLQVACQPSSSPYITRALIANRRITALGPGLSTVAIMLKNNKHCDGTQDFKLADWQALYAVQEQEQERHDEKPECVLAQSKTSTVATSEPQAPARSAY